MDLRFEAAAANELYENTKNDAGFRCTMKILEFTSKKILTLDKVSGVSIREQKLIEDSGVDLKLLAENLIQHFLKTCCKRRFFSCVICIREIYL